MQKLIFLDIDGVINICKTFLDDPIFDKASISLICDLCEQHGLQIVISSTWRMAKTKEDFQARLERFGDSRIMQYLHQDWRTPVLHKFRGREIDAWLARQPDPSDILFVCVDDDGDFDAHHNLVQTDGYEGFGIIEYQMVELFFKTRCCPPCKEHSKKLEDLYRLYQRKIKHANRQLERLSHMF